MPQSSSIAPRSCRGCTDYRLLECGAAVGDIAERHLVPAQRLQPVLDEKLLVAAGGVSQPRRFSRMPSTSISFSIQGPTKNHTNRAVPVPGFLARLLKTEIEGRDNTALVFPSARGSAFLTLGQARYAFTKATAAVDGCAGVRLHDLRHSCASLAISAGANVKVVQRLLGHKTAVLTLDRYGHLFPDDLDAVATAFDAAADALRTTSVPNAIWITPKSR